MRKTRSVKTVTSAPPSRQPFMSPTHEAIADRAYQLFLSRGRQGGHEVEDWLAAERELRQLDRS